MPVDDSLEDSRKNNAILPQHNLLGRRTRIRAAEPSNPPLPYTSGARDALPP